MKSNLSVVAIMALLGAALLQPVAVHAASAETFNKLDVNGDGFLTLEESDPNQDLVEAFADGDMNDDGKLDMAEFEKLEISDE